MSFYIMQDDFKNGYSSVMAKPVSYDTGNALLFIDEDYFIHEPYTGVNFYGVLDGVTTLTKREYKYFNGYPVGSNVETNVKYDSGYIGVIARYNPIGFLMFKFSEEGIEFIKVLGTTQNRLSNIVPIPVVTNTEYKIKITDNGISFAIYINDEYICSFIYSQSDMEIGFFGLCSTIKNICKDFKVNTQLPEGYTVTGNMSIFSDNGLIAASNLDNTALNNYCTTSILCTAGEELSINVFANGAGTIEVSDGTTTKTIAVTDSYDVDIVEYKTSITPITSTVTVKIIPSTYIYIKEIQTLNSKIECFNEYDNTNVFISEKSNLSLPVNITDMTNKIFSIEFKPYTISLLDTDKRIIYCLKEDINNYIIVYYKNTGLIGIDVNEGGVVSSYSTVTLALSDTNYNSLNVTYDGVNIKINLQTIDGNYLEENIENVAMPVFTINNINIGCTDIVNFNNANSIFNEIKIYDSFINNGNILFHYTFNGTIMENASGIKIGVTGLPRQMSPISVNYKDNNEELYRISTFNDTNGGYTNFEEEDVVYSGNMKIKISCSDIDTEFAKPSVLILNGNDISSTYLSIKKIEGNILYLDISSEQNVELEGKVLRVKYSPKNSYSIVYDEDDSFNVVLHSTSGKPIQISYETSDESASIIKSCNMNPMYNPNHRGFVYLAEESLPAASLDITLSKSMINGETDDYSYIIIDAFDKYGNPATECSFSFNCSSWFGGTTNKVEIEEACSPDDTIKLEHMSGRYIYKYTLNNNYSSKYKFIGQEIVTITENNSGISESIKLYIFM